MDLHALDPVTVPPAADLIAAALIHARDPSQRDGSRLSWGRYAYTSSCQLLGRADCLSLLAGSIYWQLLAELGASLELLEVSRSRLAACRDLGNQALVLFSRCRLAEALHANGQCDAALAEITDVVARWKSLADRTPDDDQAVLLTWARVLAGCGAIVQAAERLREHADLLAGLDHDRRNHAAQALAATEHSHLAVCSRPRSVPPGGIPPLQASWLTVLNTLGPLPPGGRVVPSTPAPAIRRKEQR